MDHFKLGTFKLAIQQDGQNEIYILKVCNKTLIRTNIFCIELREVVADALRLPPNQSVNFNLEDHLLSFHNIKPMRIHTIGHNPSELTYMIRLSSIRGDEYVSLINRKIMTKLLHWLNGQ